ncbi:MAG: hypothetical protein ABSH51_30565, partial [Solirubrobacteraceae bacterium]
MLITSFSPGCYSANALSLSRAPFHRELPIAGADYTGNSQSAILGPWLGPEDPTFVDPSGNYRDGITGRTLIASGAQPVGGNSGGPMSCSGRVAEPDGVIGTPIRVGTRVRVIWRQFPGTDGLPTRTRRRSNGPLMAVMRSSRSGRG